MAEQSASVAELRKQAREAGVKGYGSMRKAELQAALGGNGHKGARTSAPRGRRTGERTQRGGSGGGARRGSQTSHSVSRAQWVTAPGTAPERPGRTMATTEHEVIRAWADQRGAKPATVTGTERSDHLGVLRLIFTDGSDRLREVSWDEWFGTFDERGLRFLFQETKRDGSTSNFFRLENPDREDG